jgi:Trk K+ transport system NAD-binding subunit
MTKHIQHSFSQDKMHIVMPNTEQLMRDKLADSLKEFNQWVDLIRNGEAEVTGLTVTRKNKWVGLTNQELADCWDTIPEKAMRRVEAKLKEKNT